MSPVAVECGVNIRRSPTPRVRPTYFMKERKPRPVLHLLPLLFNSFSKVAHNVILNIPRRSSRNCDYIRRSARHLPGVFCHRFVYAPATLIVCIYLSCSGKLTSSWLYIDNGKQSVQWENVYLKSPEVSFAFHSYLSSHHANPKLTPY